MADVSLKHVIGCDAGEELTFVELTDELQTKKGCTVYFDIETGPGPQEVLDELYDGKDVKLPAYPGEFDPSKIKYGNLGEEKRSAKLASERIKHEQALASWDHDCKVAREEAYAKFLEKAPLNAETAEVLAVGYGLRVGDGVLVCPSMDGEEEDHLRRFWSVAWTLRKNNGRLFSFNGHRFDIPMLTRRSTIKGVPKIKLLTRYNKMEDFCLDALEEWRMGGSWSENISLKKLAFVLGVHQKMEGMDGSLFHRVLTDDPAKAREYLVSDVLATAGVVEKVFEGIK